MAGPDLHERVVIVLVQPQHPGNVGAVARAMKNMGLWQLTIVDPPPSFDPERARWMAPGAHDLLAAARIVSTLDEGLEGCHRAVATTARHRRYHQPVIEPGKLAERVLDEDGVTAILFGREDHGLANEDVRRCDALLRIATPEHASLNLAQAALLVSHALFEAARRRGLEADGRSLGGSRQPRATRSLNRTDRRDARADLPALEPLVSQIDALLQRVGYTRGRSPEKLHVTTRTALQGAGLTFRHVEALRGLVNRVDWALDHPDVDWTATRGSRDDDAG